MRLIGLGTLLLSCTLFGCNDSNGATTAGGGVIVVPSEYAFFSEAGGQNLTMVSRGGEGLTGDGGGGGVFYVNAYSSGDILVVPYGTINTDYEVPDVRPELGFNPRTITVSETIQPEPGGNEILGDDGVNTATGLWVQAGVTLTLMPNNDSNAQGRYSRAHMAFEDGVIVEGAIFLGPGDSKVFGDGLGNYTASLLIQADNFWMGTAGVIETHGESVAAGRGADAGDVHLDINGNVVSYGRVVAYGGDGVTGGGQGGDVEFESSWYGVYNLGAIDTNGGSATGAGAMGEWAGDIEMYAHYGALVNKGTLTAVGGDGPAGGDWGGDVTLEIGMLVNAARIDTRGGHATVAGPGGLGGDIYLESCSGTMRVTGDLDSRGGNGLGVEGNGGHGGNITFYLQDCDYIYGEYVAGGMFVGANLDASGGSGAAGGWGGELNFEPDQDEIWKPGLQPTIICGYTVIDVRGGDGAMDGGDASDYNQIYNDGAYDENDTEYLFDIHMQVDVLARGGNGLSGRGGRGGSFEINQDDYVYNPMYDRVVRTTANFDLRGGNGTTRGGRGGEFMVFDHYMCVNEGDIDTSGGRGGSDYGG
ncbi:MAG: hypothetical protein OER88_06235, partial [Planctomycetota bacterium]|nr:hypothetical protein [Planctomycetota bacterium]